MAWAVLARSIRWPGFQDAVLARTQLTYNLNASDWEIHRTMISWCGPGSFGPYLGFSQTTDDSVDRSGRFAYSDSGVPATGAGVQDRDTGFDQNFILFRNAVGRPPAGCCRRRKPA